MRGKLPVLVIATLLVLAAVASAHHSFPATYIVNKTITIEGTVAQFLFRNPHSFLQVDALDGSGKMQRWSVEWGGAGQLTSQGVLKDTLRVGDILVITANPPRSTDGSTRVLMKTARRPADGWNWGTAPDQVVD